MSIRLVIVLASLALVTACGSSSGDGTFPVTISRTGGIAGFNDRVVVDTGGATTVTSKRGAAGGCTLSADTLVRLLAAVTSAPKVANSSTTGPRIADEMFTTLEAPTTGGAVRLSDAPSTDLAVVGEILADVTGASPAYRLCTKA